VIRKDFIKLTALAGSYFAASGVNILVTHEPTFYTHWDLDEKEGDYFGSQEFTKQPLIIINHGTSEEMGMRMLNKLIKQKYPNIETIHFNLGCTYQWITG
jgi:hypothetical protein